MHFENIVLVQSEANYMACMLRFVALSNRAHVPFCPGCQTKETRHEVQPGMLGITCNLVAGLLQASAASAETTLQRIVRTSEVRIGYANENPFAYTTPDGVVTGESP